MLIIVPTPIGNLKDITLRALEALREADVIACEDTRHSRKLLDAYEIKKTLVSYHEHSAPKVTEELLEMIKQGKTVALVSDGGTPLISDPGFQILHRAIAEGIKVEVLPGACAIPTALAVSGLAVDAFSFFGFIAPKSAARKRTFELLKDREETLIFYESPHRLTKMLADIENVLGEREVVVARELTKKFEEVVRGKVSKVLDHFSNKPVKGEIVVLIAGRGRKELF